MRISDWSSDVCSSDLDRLIDAREADLDDDPPADMAALEEYAEATSAPLVWLALDVLGAADDSACRAGREVGIVWALTGLLQIGRASGRDRVWQSVQISGGAGSLQKQYNKRQLP